MAACFVGAADLFLSWSRFVHTPTITMPVAQAASVSLQTLASSNPDTSADIRTAVAAAMQASSSDSSATAAGHAVLVAAAVKTASETAVAAPPPAPVVASQPAIVQTAAVGESDAASAFTPDWYRCVIIPESSNRPHIISGLFGILVSTWHDYGMPGVPGEYSPAAQARIALKIYTRNGGFGPPAWNNHVRCT